MTTHAGPRTAPVPAVSTRVDQRPAEDTAHTLRYVRGPMSIPPTPLDVLVVDDDEACRELNAAVVERLGHRCRTAVDGNDALAQLVDHPADVIVSDWDMPGMNGAELCQRIRGSGDDAPYTYFIIVTALTDRAHLLGAMEAGADDFQRKPVNLDELEARLFSAGRVVHLHRKLAARTAELRGDNARFYLASRTDALTGAGNRLGLDEELAILFARGQRYGHKCSLAIADLDYFKAYNDHFGHVAGDDALRRIAEAMRTTLRAVDRLYRFGGEEFVVLLVEQTLEAAERAMDRTRSAVESLGIPSPSTGGALTLSVGIAQLDPSLDRTASDWLRRADEVLYEAKSAGRNRVLSTMPPRLA
jgi:two-component system, cell cycle response regulator